MARPGERSGNQHCQRGSPVSEPSTARNAGAVSTGARVRTSVRVPEHQPEADGDPASSLLPSPDERKTTTPISTNIGATARCRTPDLGDQRAAEVGAEHNGERRPQIDRASGSK